MSEVTVEGCSLVARSGPVLLKRVLVWLACWPSLRSTGPAGVCETHFDLPRPCMLGEALRRDT